MSKSTEKRLNSYPLQDGRTALTSRNLAYASNEKGILDLASVREDDAKTINLIADPTLAFLLTELYGKEWLNPEAVMRMDSRERLELPYYQHCSVLSQGKVYVRDDKFVPLEQFIKHATTKEMAAMLWDVAIQAALAQVAVVSKPADATGENK